MTSLAGGRARWLLAMLSCMAGSVLVAGTGDVAVAGSVTSCSHPSATFDQSEPGDKVRLSAGYERNPAPTFDVIGFQAKGVNANGDPIGSAGSCGNEDKWETLTITLGDRGDALRLDGRKPEVLSGGRVPKFVAVTAFGGPGRDTLRGHRGPDTMNGEGGRDLINVAGGGADTANCGPGKDTAILSGADQAVGCEKGITPSH